MPEAFRVKEAITPVTAETFPRPSRSLDLAIVGDPASGRLLGAHFGSSFPVAPHAIILFVKIAFDESGPNLTFDSERFESCVLCGLVVPDSRLADVQDFTKQLRTRTSRSELKASRMRPAHVLEVADFLAANHVSAVAFVTDNQMMRGPVVDDFRLQQAVEIARERARLAAVDANDSRLGDLDLLTDQVAGCAAIAQISRSEFVQQQQMPELILECIRRACLRYHRPEWRQAFQRFEFVFDRKLPGQLGTAERYVHENLEPMLGLTRRLVLDLPADWRDEPDHPFRQFDDPGGGHTLLTTLLRNRRWVDSRDDDCIQLADVVAGTVRMVTEQGPRASRAEAYEALRQVLTDEHGYTLRFFRPRAAPEPDMARYGWMLRAWPPDPPLQVTPAGAVLLGG